MARLKNPEILMKRLAALMCMSAFIAIQMWSQKPQTGFSDLKCCKPRHNNAYVATPHQDYHMPDRQPDYEDYEPDPAWTCTSYLNLGYVFDQQLNIAGTSFGYSSKWGASAQIGNSYMVPRDAILGIVKVALDATWLDLSGVQYGNSYNDFYHITAGMGVGASLHVAPLAHMSDALRPLRIEGYCRFVPSYSLLLTKYKSAAGDDDRDSGSGSEYNGRGAFVPVVSLGIALDYRAIGIGYEYRFGNAKYKSQVDGGPKTKYDMTSSRIYISWRM